MGKDKEKTPKKPATRVRSFRLTQSESDLIDKLAAEYDVTPSHVMRLVMSSNIKKYFGDLKYMDHDQGVEIKKIITDIAEYLSERGKVGFGDYTASQIVPDDDEDEGEVDLNEEADDDDEE